MTPKSLYISRAVSNFYGTEIKIWAGFGPDGNTERKKIEVGFFMFSGPKKIQKDIVASAIKSCIK